MHLDFKNIKMQKKCPPWEAGQATDFESDALQPRNLTILRAEEPMQGREGGVTTELLYSS